ncbi:MAG: thiol-disulfide isomerase-like thioredoxin [Actinomycetia bacterium]|nr:thiol-disulfide isomerase-like thioredoxin [Actinomycetes bacterium]
MKTRHRARWIALTVGLAVAIFGVILATQVNNEPTYKGGVVLGKPAPTVSLQKLDGSKLTSANLSGKVVIVNFWNTWCIPCQQEANAIASFGQAHKNDPDLVMLSVVRDDTKAAVSSWQKQHQSPWTIAFDPSSQAAIDFGTTGQPETYAIAADGTVVASQLGPVGTGNLDSMLACARGSCQG